MNIHLQYPSRLFKFKNQMTTNMKNLLSIFTSFLFIIAPYFCYGQISKQWELYVPSEYSQRPSHNTNTNCHLKTLQLSEDRYVVLGSKINLNDDRQIYLFSFDTDGNLLWEYLYTSENSVTDIPTDMTLNSVGDILVTGKVVTYQEWGFEKYIEFSNYLLLSISSDGILNWEKEIIISELSNDFGTSVVVDSEDNIYTLGKITNEDNDDTNNIMLHKFDRDGNQIFANNLEGVLPYHLYQLEDRLVAVVDQDFSPSKIYHYDFAGNLIKSYAKEYIGRKKLKFDHQNNFYNYNFTGAFRLDKFDIDGELIWSYEKETNLPDNVSGDELTDFIIDEVDNVYVTGRFYGEHYGDKDLYTNGDILTSKLDGDGNVIWEHIYNYDDTISGQYGQKILLDEEGLTYVIGYQTEELNGELFASDDMVILIYDVDGDLLHHIIHNGDDEGEDYGINLIIDAPDFYGIGYSENNFGKVDYNIIKYSKLSSTDEIEFADEPITVFPNPGFGEFTIDCDQEISNVQIIDYSGRVVLQKANIPCHSTLDLKAHPDGIYSLKYTMNGKDYVQSLIKI